MKKKHVEFLKKIVETPSPTGSEVAVADIVRERLMPIADEIHTDTMGSVHATYEGFLHLAAAAADGFFDEEPDEFEASSYDEQFVQDDFDDFHDPYFDEEDDEDDEDSDGDAYAEDAFEGEAQQRVADVLPPEAPLTLMLAAHMDEVGLMVTYISDEGFLSIAAIGGVDAAILPGMRVDVHAQDETLRGVVGRKPIHLIDSDERKAVTPLDNLVIDLGMPGKAVKKKVRVGDSITLAAGFEQFGEGMATSRAFDDKVGVFIACRVMEKLAKKADYAGNFVAAITVQEEIGTRGAITSAHAVMPDVALAFDVTHATDYPGIDKSKHGDIVCGGGPVIARGPNINPVVFERLVKAAEDEGIPYQLEAEPSATGTDARAIQVTREGIPTGLVSIPLRYMHTPTEVICLDDVSATIRLIARFAADLDEAADFVPGHAEDYESDLRLESGSYDEDYEFLMDEVVRLTEEVADLQVLAGIAGTEDSGWDSYGADYQDAYDFQGDEVVSPEDAPFGRQQGAISAEFASIDIDAKPTSDAPGASSGELSEDDYDEDDAPAAYAEGSEGAPAVRLKFEDVSVSGDIAEDSEYDEPGEQRPAPQAASEGANLARSSLPIVMMDTSAFEDDE